MSALAAHEPDFQHIGLDDRADIHAIGLRDPAVGDAPAAVLLLLDLGEALIGGERIAAMRDEGDARRRIPRASESR